MADLEDFKIPMDANFSDIIVPTIDTIRSTFVLELLLGAQKTVGNCFPSIHLINVWLGYAHNPFHTFPRNFPVDGEADNFLRTCCGLVVCVADLLWESRPTCYGLATGKLV